MPNFIVNIIETDEFGWNVRLEEIKEFTFEDDAKKFVKEYNSTYHEGRKPMQSLVARQPREHKPIETPSKIEIPDVTDQV